MDIMGGMLLGILFFAAVGLLVQAAFLLWGASLAKIDGRSYGKALGISALSGLATWLVGMVADFSFTTIQGLVVGLIVTALLAMGIFKTSFGKALAAAAIAWVLSAVIFGLLAVMGMAAFLS